jgi:hypothetical protein
LAVFRPEIHQRREVIEVFQPKFHQKFLGGSVQDGIAAGLPPASRADEPPIEESVQDARSMHTTGLHDFGGGDWLAVCD